MKGGAAAAQGSVRSVFFKQTTRPPPGIWPSEETRPVHGAGATRALDKSRFLEHPRCHIGHVFFLGGGGGTRPTSIFTARCHHCTSWSLPTPCLFRIGGQSPHVVGPSPLALFPGASRPGDYLVAVDNLRLSGISIASLAPKLKGPEGSHVRLTLNRGGREYNITVQRRKSPPAGSK
jgi:hypothetical protein